MSQPTLQQAPGLSASPSVDVLAVDLIALYTTAEQTLIGDETKLAKTALGSNVIRIGLLKQMREAAQRIATMLHLRSYPLAVQIAHQAAVDGEKKAFTSLQRQVNAAKQFALTPHGLAAANQIALDLARGLEGVDRQILRFGDDAYTAITASVSTSLVMSTDTPSTAQLLAWRALTSRGIVGFTDRSGRQWNLASYVDMAVRTASQRAFNAAHLARMTALGVDKFTINHDGHPCPLCLPWEGKVLGNEPGPGIDATVDEATDAGLWHPNCRHVLLPYFPGVTNLGRSSDWTPADEQRYQATQKLRYLERQVRAGKYQQAAALTPMEAKRARAKIHAGQAAIRQHVEQHALVRRPRRERLDLGNR